MNLNLSNLKVVRGQFVRLGNQINNSIRFFNVLEREIAVYLLLSYDRDSFVGQYPFISFGIFENGIYLVSLKFCLKNCIEWLSLFAKLVIYAMAAHSVLKGDPWDSFGKGINMVGIIIRYRFSIEPKMSMNFSVWLSNIYTPVRHRFGTRYPLYSFPKLSDWSGWYSEYSRLCGCLIVLNVYPSNLFSPFQVPVHRNLFVLYDCLYYSLWTTFRHWRNNAWSDR